MQYLFFLGRKSDLNFFELSRVIAKRFPDSVVERTAPDIVRVELPSEDDAQMLQDMLGGVVKIAVLLDQIPKNTTERLEEVVGKHLLIVGKPTGKIQFGLAEHGRDQKPRVDSYDIKDFLKTNGRNSRFIESPRDGLSASVLLHQDVKEIHIIEDETTITFALTVAIQNIDDWTIRDRRKPYVDRKHGMLPPKLARILVNIAVPTGEGKVYDPFCGTGTVITESMMVGIDAVGSDLRPEAVEQTQENIKWLGMQYPLVKAKGQALISDATQIEPTHLPFIPDAIVAEGYLGPLTPSPAALENVFRGLEKLYKGAFKRWTLVLPDHGAVCIALPLVEVGGKRYSLEHLIDTLGTFGYNKQSSDYVYDRPDTIVKRQIFLLEYTKK